MALWTPAEITTDLWLDASESSTITIGTGISSWADKKANGLAVSQGTGTKQPSIASAALNGLDVARFDGIDDFLSGGDILDLGTGSIALFVLGKFSSTGGSQAFVAKSIAAGALGRYFINKKSSNYLAGSYSVTDSINAEAVTSSVYDDTDYHLFCFLADRTNGTVKLIIDGTVVAADTCPTTSEDLSTTYRFLVGAYNDSTDTGIINPLNGDIGEVVVVRDVVSSEDLSLIEGYSLWKWGLEANLPSGHSYESAAPTYSPGGIISSGLEQLWSSPVQSGLQQLWSVLKLVESGLEQVFGSPLEAGLKQPWHMAPVLQAGLDQRWSQARVVAQALVQRWGQAKALQRGLEQPWVDAKVLQAGLKQEFGVAGTVLSSGLEQPWEVKDTTPLQSGLQQIWLGGGIDVDQEYAVKVTYGGAEISPSQVRIRRSRSEFGLLASITVPAYAAEMPGEVLPEEYAGLDAAEQDLARARAAVIVEVNGEVVAELLATGQAVSESPGEATVTLTAESAPVLLDAPYAAVLQAEFGPGNMSILAGQVCSETIISPVWQTVDWPVPGGVYYANNEVPLSVLQKATREIGARLAADPDGALAVQPYYPVSRPLWWTTEPDLYLSAGANFFNISLRPLVRSGENRFRISDQLDAQASLRYEEKDLSTGVKEIRGYEVPWSGELIPLQTSGADWVVIEAGIEDSEVIERELVEIVNGQGRTRSPISEMIDRDYGNNTPLGAISFSEDGAIQTAIPGQTLVLVTYRTRFWRWKVLDPHNEQVQLFSLPAWSDLPVTIVVTFGDVAASQGFVTAEADGQLNIDVDGNAKSEFAPGDEFHFLLQHDATMRMNSMAVSSGAVYAKTNIQRRDKGQQMSFVSKAVQELPYIPAGEVDFSWYGRTPTVTQEERKISVDAHPAIGEASYQADMHGFTLEPPPLRLLAEENYYILIQIEMVSS